MGVFDIGDYRVQQMNKGFKVSWEKGSIRHNLELDIEHLIKEHIESHTHDILKLIYLMEAGPTDLLNDPIGALVIQNMPEEDTIPGSKLSDKDMVTWNRQQLLKGYNRIQATNFTWDMIRELL